MPPDRDLRRPSSGAISRSADAAVAHRYAGRHQAGGRAADPGVLRSAAAPWVSSSTRSSTSSKQRLDIEVASERPGVLGYAVVKGSATEIIDVGHFLPQAFADWFRRRDKRAARRRAHRSCWSTTSAFFRDMLAPLIKAAGYQRGRRRFRRAGAGGDQVRRAGRHRRHRHRDAGHGRFRARRGVARKSRHRRNAGHRAVGDGVRRRDRARPRGRVSTISSPSSTAPG